MERTESEFTERQQIRNGVNTTFGHLKIAASSTCQSWIDKTGYEAIWETVILDLVTWTELGTVAQETLRRVRKASTKKRRRIELLIIAL